MSDPQLEIVDVGGCRLRTATWGTGPVEIVLLHDGLGSIPQWRGVPSMIAERTGVGVMAYERAGHGASTPVPDGAWPTDWLHREADVFAGLLRAVEVVRPLVVGHSDGGSIALLHAGAAGSCCGVIALAAHSWVESVCTDSIVVMRQDSARFVAGLEPHHDAPAELFDAWSGVWISDDFATWDIRPKLATIDVPTIVAQGERDEYATDAQLVETAAAIGSNGRVERIAGAGHIIHHERPTAVVELIVDFYDQLRAATAPTQGD